MKRIGLLCAIAALSCGSTGGALVTLPFRVGGVAGPLTFTTPTGWTVHKCIGCPLQRGAAGSDRR